MPKKVDLTGKRFGRLVAVKETELRSPSGDVIWDCICDCGNAIQTPGKSLWQKNTESCGCIKKSFDKLKGYKLLENMEENYFKENTNLSRLDMKKQKNNTSGIKGVSWDSEYKLWSAQIGFKGKRIRLGRFANIEDAAKARKEAEEKYFTPILEKYGRLKEEQN